MSYQKGKKSQANLQRATVHGAEVLDISAKE